MQRATVQSADTERDGFRLLQDVKELELDVRGKTTAIFDLAHVIISLVEVKHNDKQLELGFKQLAHRLAVIAHASEIIVNDERPGHTDP